ncbi:MAG: cation:proton antiporter, partial [Gaiellaceae bacterium]
MGFGAHDDLVLLGLLVAAAALIAAAPGLRIPYPILLVLGGLGLGFVPGAPHIRLPPELVLVAFLPPLLYYAAYATSLRDLRRNVRPISLLAIGLVLATTIVVAVVAHATIDLSWASAFVLGAIVSPTDPVAATAIAQRLGVPRRIVTVIEGESLINDATALVAYRLAVVAVVSGTFSIWHAGLAFLGNVVGGVAVGLAVGLLVAAVRRRLDDPPVETTISLITGYLAYLPASALGASGVVAVVTAGVVLGWMTPRLTNAEQRLKSAGAWEVIVFVLN